MYLAHAGLRENPFTLACDPRFLYYSDAHCDAMAHLLYGVRERKGLILLLGEAGTGKTTLVRATLAMLRSSRVVASVIMNPLLTQYEDFLESVLAGFGLATTQRTTVQMSRTLETFLMDHFTLGNIPVLIIDEAQQLDRPILECVRLLSNLEANGQKLLQIILAAQPEMSAILDSFAMRALRQRIVVRCRLSPLSPQDTWIYILTRLTLAGLSDEPLFDTSAVESIYRFSGGIPRLINMIGDNCLLAGYAAGIHTITSVTVEKVARHLELSEHEPGCESVREGVREDIVRASTSWKEVMEDIRTGAVPEILKRFVERLTIPEIPEESALCAATAQKGQ